MSLPRLAILGMKRQKARSANFRFSSVVNCRASLSCRDACTQSKVQPGSLDLKRISEPLRLTMIRRKVSRSGWARGFIDSSSPVVLLQGIDCIRGSDNVVFAEGVYEIVNVSADDIDVHFVCSADFVHNTCLPPPLLYQLQDLRADDV